MHRRTFFSAIAAALAPKPKPKPISVSDGEYALKRALGIQVGPNTLLGVRGMSDETIATLCRELQTQGIRLTRRDG